MSQPPRVADLMTNAVISVDENETLRAEGFKVFGGGRYSDRMEHDRDACLALVGQYGLLPPPSHAFTAASDAIWAAYIVQTTTSPACIHSTGWVPCLQNLKKKALAASEAVTMMPSKHPSIMSVALEDQSP